MDKHDINGNIPIFINIGEWDGDDEELDKAVQDVSNTNHNHTVIVDDIPLED
ncbi:terminase [Staphylococcus aureus]|nr:terminase [Staphylococcus aureus]MRW10248.1 terminase [Staphylococcus aureus]